MTDVDAVIVPESRANETFKALGFSVFMVKGTVGIAMVEVVQRAERLNKVYTAWMKRGVNTNISKVLRELASVSDAVEKYQDAQKKARGGV